MRFTFLLCFALAESYINLNQYFSNSGQNDVKVDEELSEKGMASTINQIKFYTCTKTVVSGSKPRNKKMMS